MLPPPLGAGLSLKIWRLDKIMRDLCLSAQETARASIEHLSTALTTYRTDNKYS